MSLRTLVLDTGPIIGLAKRSKVGEAVRSRHLATEISERPLISVMSVAECRSIAFFNNWGAARREALDALLASFTIVGIYSDAPIIESYVRMYSYLRTVGKNFEKNQNDLWIAALAHVSDGVLLTTDFKLLPLCPAFIAIEAYDPVTGALQAV